MVDPSKLRQSHPAGGGRSATRSEAKSWLIALAASWSDSFLAPLPQVTACPTPEVNARVGPYLVDFLWRDRRLIVETDGYRYHRGRQRFEDDRERDLELRMRGFDVLRLSYRQVVEASADVTALLASVLSAPAGSTPPRGSLGFPTD